MSGGMFNFSPPSDAWIERSDYDLEQGPLDDEEQHEASEESEESPLMTGAKEGYGG